MRVRVPRHIPKDQHRIYRHFSRRVSERLPGMSAEKLWTLIIEGIEQDSDSMTFLKRICKQGRRAWIYSDGDVKFVVVFCHEANAPITVLTDQSKPLKSWKGQSISLWGRLDV